VSRCRECAKKEGKEFRRKHPGLSGKYYRANIEKRREYGRKWRSEHSEQAKSSSLKYYRNNKDKSHQRYLENKDKYLEKSRQWEKENKERIHYLRSEWRKKNKDKINAAKASWRANNPERTKEQARREGISRRSKAKGKLRDYMSHAIWRALRGDKNNISWLRMVPYTPEELMRHLEKKFKRGMTWENYGPDWHVDHVIPVSAFNFTSHTDIDFQRCWSLKNLQPLWKEENLSKGGKVDKPFQPSLSIAL
jgi:hypothetical protein